MNHRGPRWCHPPSRARLDWLLGRIDEFSLNKKSAGMELTSIITRYAPYNQEKCLGRRSAAMPAMRRKIEEKGAANG